MIVIDTYTATYDDAVRQRRPLRAGSLVRVAESADDREWDSFARRVYEAGLELDWLSWMPRAKFNVHRLVPQKRDP